MRGAVGAQRLQQDPVAGGEPVAVAVEQEMAARTQEMRAKVVESEAEIPLAIAEAFRKGNLHNSAMDANGAAPH